MKLLGPIDICKVAGRWGAAGAAALSLLFCITHLVSGWQWPILVLTILLTTVLVLFVLRPTVKTVSEVTREPGRDLRIHRRSLVPRLIDNTPRDDLTGLPDYTALEPFIAAAIESAKRSGRKAALVAFDVDRLKDVNGCYGITVGDRVLQTFASRLSEVDADITVRLGGDRFVMLMADLASIAEAEFAGAACLDRTMRPMRIGDDTNDELIPSASVGIAVFPDHGSDCKELLQHAEMAIDSAKRAGGRRFCMFNMRMIETLRQRRAMEHDLKNAIANNELDLAFQPQIDLRSGLIFGAEALMRWHSADRGRVPPSIFIPVAEASGLIKPLGRWLIHEACRRAREWKDQELDMLLAINISIAQLREHDLIPDLERSLNKFQLRPEDLELELTESLFVDPAELMMRRTLDSLADMGISLAIDDFGTGFSSLSYLKRLPVSKIKIDKSFINGVGREAADEALIKTIISLAQTFEKTVLAEGVENESQANFLREQGCHQAQGYHYARPLSFDACTALVMRQRAARAGRETLITRSANGRNRGAGGDAA